jgi:hypothetical protein
MRSFRFYPFTLASSLLLISFFLAQPDRVTAQERKGSISGRVTDDSGDVLQGARIEVQPSGQNIVSDIQVGYFYKWLTNPIVTETKLEDNFQPTVAAPKGTYLVTQPFNAGSGWVSGVEAAYIQHLSFLPGILKGLGFSANHGYIASQANGLARTFEPSQAATFGTEYLEH